MSHPLPAALVELIARLDADNEYSNFVAGSPEGDGWVAGTDLVDDSVLAEWFAHLVSEHGEAARDVAGSYLSSWIAEIVVLPVAAAIRDERRSWPIDLAALSVHRDPGGWFDGLAVAAGHLRVVRGDPAEESPGVEVFDDVDALIAATAAEVAATVGPMFAAVRRLAPFGVRGMWGNLADGFVSDAVWAAQRRGNDTAAAFAAADRFTDAVAAAAGVGIVRPSPLTITWSGGPTVVSRKGTCCLFYKTVPDARPDGDGYCTSCPKAEPDHQHAKLAAWLEELASGA